MSVCPRRGVRFHVHFLCQDNFLKDELLTLAVTSLCGVSFPFRVWMFSKVGSRIFSSPIARPGQVPLVECL